MSKPSILEIELRRQHYLVESGLDWEARDLGASLNSASD